MKNLLIPLLFFLCSFGLLGQTQTPEELRGSWYTQDGTNTLGVYFGKTFMLYDSEFWDIDAIQGDAINASNVSGIKSFGFKQVGNELKLVDKNLSFDLRKEKVKDLSKRETGKTDVSQDFFKKDQVVLHGVVVPKDTMPFTATVIYNYAFGEGQRKYVSEVDDEGRFKIIFPLDHPQTIMFRSGDAFTSFFATPGTKQALVLEEASFSRGFDSWYQIKDMDFMGSLAAENEEQRLLHPEYMKVRKYFESDSLQKALAPQAYLDYRLELLNDHKAFLNKYYDSIPTSEFVKDFNLRDVRTYAADDLKRYVWMHNLGKNGGRIEAVDVPESYMDKIISLMPDDIGDLMTDNYSNLIREFTRPMMPRENQVFFDKTLAVVEGYFDNQLLPEDEKTLVSQWLERERVREEHNGYVNFKDYPALQEKYGDKLNELRDQVFWDRLLNVSQNFSQVQASSLIAIYLDMRYMTKGLSIPEYILEKLDQVDIFPSVRETIDQQVKDLEILRNKKFVEGVEISDASDNLLNQIREKHQGKVVYIDVWATWCGPCISQFRNLPSIKKSNLEDVAFVYICAQSEKKAFDAMVKKYELTGDNYFLTDQQYQLFDKEAKISGFPTYMVITKEGKLVRNGIKRPSAGKDLVNQLLEFSTRE